MFKMKPEVNTKKEFESIVVVNSVILCYRTK